MPDSFFEYNRNFHSGQQVRITSAAPGMSDLRAIAQVTVLTRDLLELELEEELLPDSESISVGMVLEMHSGREGVGFRCRSLLVSGTDSSYLLVRLVGDVIREDLREYYRIDTFLPLRYTPMPGWDKKSVSRKWYEINETKSKESSKPSAFIYNIDFLEPDFDGENASVPIEYEPPVAANISGGGLRTCLQDELPVGSFAFLNLFIPSPASRSIVIAGEVLYSNHEFSQEGIAAFTTGFKFMNIDERDRDVLINYIQRIQSKDIRRQNEQTAPPPPPPEETTEEKSIEPDEALEVQAPSAPKRNFNYTSIIIFALVLVALYLVYFFKSHKF